MALSTSYRRGLTQVVLLWLAVSQLHCQGYEFVFQVNQRVGGRGYEVDVGVAEKTDILFVIDNSGSMLEEQEELKANMATFVEMLTQSANDYSIGLISTDIARRPGPSCGPCCDRDTDGDGLPDWTNCDDGRLYAADFQNRVFRRPVGLEGQRPPQEEVDALVAEFNDTIGALGIGGTAFEAPLEAMRRALDPSGDPLVRHLNSEFLRPDASLAVIFLTDEDDCSYEDSWYDVAGRDDAECYYDPDALDPKSYVDFLVRLKGGIEAVRVAGIVGGIVVDPEPVEGLGFTPTGCFTVADALSPDFGKASSACGCWDSRFKVDTRDGYSGDFYCNYMSEAPYSQEGTRVPDVGHSQGGCRALPATRLVTFLEEVHERRQQAQLSRGVLIDSICRADYGETLRNIAVTVALSDCFLLREAPRDIDAVRVRYNGDILARVDDDSTSPGWSYDAEQNAVCLEGGISKDVGDQFDISVLIDERGFE